MEIRLYKVGMMDRPEEMELIHTTDDEMYKTIQFGGFVEVNEKIYRMCMYSIKNGILAVEPVDDFEEEPDETEYESEFICPYCKDVEYDAWELSEDTGEHKCGSCGSTMKYTKEYEVTYSIEPLECAPITKLD